MASRRHRTALGLSTSAAAAAGAVMVAASAATAAAASAGGPPAAHVVVKGMDARTFLEISGLTVQESNGYLAALGPAGPVKAAAAALKAAGLGDTALFTGPGGTCDGIVVLTGNGRSQGTDFQVVNMTAADVQNNSTAQDAVYSDASGDLEATVAPGADVGIPPADVDFAAYPVGSTPPPDNRGLNPNAQFTWVAPNAAGQGGPTSH
jgi:hypothetical protein